MPGCRARQVEAARKHGPRQRLADRLRKTLRACDTAACFSGDEFAILQSVMAEPGDAAWLAARLVAALAIPYRAGSHNLRISVSVGVALAPFDAADPSGLREQADAALYRAKREGRSTFRFAGLQPSDQGDEARGASAA